ncbi:uncharacterized protein PG986_008374 [Apiospora aurea]|uniref:Uncharacterized protein n=1 Tax=Apiospora aurea TaxID=335848 RepID=A0ABR1QF78_9PEZI
MYHAMPPRVLQRSPGTRGGDVLVYKEETCPISSHLIPTGGSGAAGGRMCCEIGRPLPIASIVNLCGWGLEERAPYHPHDTIRRFSYSGWRRMRNSMIKAGEERRLELFLMAKASIFSRCQKEDSTDCGGGLNEHTNTYTDSTTDVYNGCWLLLAAT